MSAVCFLFLWTNLQKKVVEADFLTAATVSVALAWIRPCDMWPHIIYSYGNPPSGVVFSTIELYSHSLGLFCIHLINSLVYIFMVLSSYIPSCFSFPTSSLSPSFLFISPPSCLSLSTAYLSSSFLSFISSSFSIPAFLFVSLTLLLIFFALSLLPYPLYVSCPCTWKLLGQCCYYLHEYAMTPRQPG